MDSTSVFENLLQPCHSLYFPAFCRRKFSDPPALRVSRGRCYTALRGTKYSNPHGYPRAQDGGVRARVSRERTAQSQRESKAKATCTYRQQDQERLPLPIFCATDRESDEGDTTKCA